MTRFNGGPGGECPVAPCDITLDRLEEKGLLTSRLAGGSDSRGGRPKRYFSATATGLKGVKHSVQMLARMQEGLEPLLGT